MTCRPSFGPKSQTRLRVRLGAEHALGRWAGTLSLVLAETGAAGTAFGEAARSLRALAESARDGVGRRVNAELCLQARESFADGVQAQEQLPRELCLALDGCGRVEHLGLPRGEPEA